MTMAAHGKGVVSEHRHCHPNHVYSSFGRIRPNRVNDIVGAVPSATGYNDDRLP